MHTRMARIGFTLVLAVAVMACGARAIDLNRLVLDVVYGEERVQAVEPASTELTTNPKIVGTFASDCASYNFSTFGQRCVNLSCGMGANASV